MSLEPDSLLGAPMVTTAAASAHACELHVAHDPAPMTSEWHHVLPVAWQLYWKPRGPEPHPGEDPNGRGHLWDSRGVWLCPTGHKNVHWVLVRAMHANAVVPSGQGDTGQMAALGIHRFAEAGGDSRKLIEHGLWGQA
jgi:hypothetical protein